MRKTYLDNIRWITVVLVVIYHVFYMYNAEGVLGGLGQITDLNVQYYDLYMYIIYPWMMPLLYIVSGISSRLYLEKHTEREFIRSRTTKLLVPSTIGLLCFQFIQGYISMSLGDAFNTFGQVPGPVLYMIMVFSGIGVLWYMQLLWVFSLLLVLFRRMGKDRLRAAGRKTNTLVLVLLAVPVWAAAQILNTPVIVVYRFGLYGLVFFLGYIIFSHDEVISLLQKRFVPFLAAALVLCVLFCKEYFGSNFADAPVNRTALFTGYCWFACLAILGGMAKYGDFSTPFTNWMNKRSFGLYLFHYLGISGVALIVSRRMRTQGLSSLPPLTALAVYLLSLAAGFAVGYLLNAVIPRIPFFRWAVMGIKKKGVKNV